MSVVDGTLNARTNKSTGVAIIIIIVVSNIARIITQSASLQFCQPVATVSCVVIMAVLSKRLSARGYWAVQ